MDYKIVARLITDKLKDPGTYYLALVVGTLINAYGQLLVPWFRNGRDPFSAFVNEFSNRPGLTMFSVFLGYAFPFCVGTYSAVSTRYKNRRIESIAEFPERKPDPVFRATRQGEFLETGAETQRLFERFNITTAQGIIGNEAWRKLSSEEGQSEGIVIHFAAENIDYLVSAAPSSENQINVYMTRLPTSA